jgi:plastocyanin
VAQKHELSRKRRESSGYDDEQKFRGLNHSPTRRSMLRIRLAIVTLLGAALVIAATASAAVPTLKGTDGPGFTISLKKGTAKVTKLKAGKYKIVIKDLSNIHNFHLTGPGLNKKTGVGPKGTFTWTVTLKKGTYKYVCDPHAAIMKGTFKVT